MEPNKDEKIKCELDGAMVHSIQLHLGKNHPGVTVADYQSKYPGAPLLSEYAKYLTEQAEAKKAAAAAAAAEVTTQPAPADKAPEGVAVAGLVAAGSPTRRPFHEVFDAGKVKDALSAKGDPIPITCYNEHDPKNQAMVPAVNNTYIWNLDELKNVIMGLELSIPTYVWGHKGSGKSEMFEQICARTNRPMIRVQHTINTEGAHVVGQWVVKGGQTIFELGPLPLAMLNGWVYVADEYDFALPSVLSVYQAVLEGKSLTIMEADAANRIIKPHPNFRMVATGNTNGSGDETGLYQGTSLQNSANYDRFGMVIHKTYMNAKDEAQILQKRLGIQPGDADKLVKFASLIREAYDAGKISEIISPRVLIFAATIGVKRGSFMVGLQMSFINKLTKVDAEAVKSMAQRVFGS